MTLKSKVNTGNKHKHYNRLTTYEDFVDYCLRKLGAPVVDINLSPEQIQDRVSDAIQYYLEYDLESVAECWWIHKITADDVTNGYISMPLDVLDVMQVLQAQQTTSTTSSSTSSTTSSSTISISNTYTNSLGTVTNPFGYNITSSTSSTYGSSIMSNANTINTLVYGDYGFGADAYMTAYNWNWWNNYWNYGYNTYGNGNNMFLYEISMQYVGIIQNIFVPNVEYLYRRRERKLWLYTHAQPLTEGTLICLYGTKILDPETDDCIWDSDWLKSYATALLGVQWGSNLSKFGSIPTAGGVTINSDAILQRYQQEVQELIEMHDLKFKEPPMPTFGCLNA